MSILCRECIESDPNERWGSYKIYCSWYRQYVDPQDTCSRARERGYYVSTAICEVLGIKQESEIPSSIKNFNINVLQANSQYSELLEKYDKIGSRVADAIMVDNDKNLCEVMYVNYLVPVVQFIKDKQNDKAINLYKTMVNSLVDYFSINETLENETRYEKGGIYQRSIKAKK